MPRATAAGARSSIARSRARGRKPRPNLPRLRAQAADGINTAPSKLTVDQYVRERIEQWAAVGTIGSKTAERYRTLLAQQIAPHLGTCPLQKLTPASIERWHTALQGKVSARTCGHAHKVLGKALRDAVRLELLTRNVTAVQPPPKVVVEETQILSPEQVAQLTAAPIATVALFTGMRAGELLALRWGNADLDAKVIKVRESLEQTKAGLRFKAPKSKAGLRDVS